MTKISQEDLNILFNEARTYSVWQDKKVSQDDLRKIYDLAKMAPTAANCQPMRLVFVETPEAKRWLEPCLDAGNVKKTMSAPVTAIIAGDIEFYKHFDKLYPITDARSWYEGNPELIEKTMRLNSALQGAYLILAARALGLDCGPMSGFNEDLINEVFFAGSTYHAMFLCNLGYGVKESLHPRLDRFDFDQACSIV